MKILLLAPHPFYQERGTPIAENLMLRVLSEEGHMVEVATFHEGDPVRYGGLTIHRIPAPPGIRNVPPGFSVKKVVCDVFLFFKASSRMRRFKPDVIHAVEESVFIARILGFLHRRPYVYDMDSSLSQQLTNRKPGLRFFLPFFRWMERGAIRHAVAVVPVCQSLADLATREKARRVVLLPDITLLDGQSSTDPALEPVDGIRFMYIGNLESYQGIDLLITAFSKAAAERDDIRLTIVGGTEQQIATHRTLTLSLGQEDRFEFAGPRPVSQLGSVLAAADVVVSPRVQGDNTPMKIYSYLDSGKPVLATRLPTHTQVLNDDIACLVDPDPEAMSRAILELAADPARRESLGAAGREFVREHHSLAAFQETLAGLYRDLASR